MATSKILCAWCGNQILPDAHHISVTEGATALREQDYYHPACWHEQVDRDITASPVVDVNAFKQWLQGYQEGSGNDAIPIEDLYRKLEEDQYAQEHNTNSARSYTKSASDINLEDTELVDAYRPMLREDAVIGAPFILTECDNGNLMAGVVEGDVTEYGFTANDGCQYIYDGAFVKI